MRLNASQHNRIIALALTLCLSMAILLPVGLVLASINHTHVCCGDNAQSGIRPNNTVAICCSICMTVYNLKNFNTTLATSSATAVSVLLWLFAIYSILRYIFLHTGFSSLISLKVRMNN